MGESQREIEYEVEEGKRPPLLVELVTRLVKEKPLASVGGVIVLLLFVTGIFADLLAPYGFNEMFLPDRLTGPSAKHILGCDHLGRDMLSRIIMGARISMIVSVCATAISQGGHLILGTISGYFGGKIDLVIQRINDANQAIPMLLLVLTVMAIVGPGIAQVIFVLGLQSAFRTRAIRSYVIAIRQSPYFDAARAIGASDIRILTRYVIPNVFPILIISISLAMGRFIITEATLSFLGFGIPPPFPSWGGMLSGAGRQYMFMAPHMAVWPGLALFLVVYGINLLGDGVRDILDPRLRGGLGRYGGAEKTRAKMLKKMK